MFQLFKLKTKIGNSIKKIACSEYWKGKDSYKKLQDSELTQDEIKPLETKNTALILAQNKELVQYVNKLKLHLSKSYSAIETMNKL